MIELNPSREQPLRDGITYFQGGTPLVVRNIPTSFEVIDPMNSFNDREAASAGAFNPILAGGIALMAARMAEVQQAQAENLSR